MAEDDREIIYLPNPEGEGTLIFNSHSSGMCAGRGCAIHSPTVSPMMDWPLRWEHAPEFQAGYMERLCPHGNWHDDPDDLAFRTDRGIPPKTRGFGFRCDCECGKFCDCTWDL